MSDYVDLPVYFDDFLALLEDFPGEDLPSTSSSSPQLVSLT